MKHVGRKSDSDKQIFRNRKPRFVWKANMKCVTKSTAPSNFMKFADICDMISSLQSYENSGKVLSAHDVMKFETKSAER